ncbi:hypothetical protein [Saccharomonospora saliphila]|uniref:hypothetical protein n=1 Tax=Saccharomonospora saliphila TaxID=369829 RepID=UPI000365060A|nr:hypothetical protein [Saccharomonospora saliphila]
MPDEATAAVRYKEIMGLARKAADDLRSWELARAKELDGEIAAAEQRVREATDREQTTAERAHRFWRMADDNISRLSWAQLGPDPEPAPSARGEHLDRYAENVRSAYQELTQAVQNLGWRAR